MSAYQRRKGAAGEREWCAVLKENGHPDAERCLAQSRSGGGDVPVPPVLWEVKRRGKNVMYTFLDQAEAAVKQYRGCRIPAVAVRVDQRDWIVTMYAKDFFELLKAEAMK